MCSVSSCDLDAFRRRITVHAVAHRPDDLFQKLDSSRQLRQLSAVETVDGGRELFDAPSASCCEDLLSFRSRLNPCQAPVADIANALDEPVLLQSRHDSRHRRRLHLLRRRELTKREWAAKDHDGEC